MLGVGRDAPEAEVDELAREVRRRWMQKARVTAEKTAWLNAVSLAQTHLGTPEARARYDRTLDLDAESAFEEVAGFVLKGVRRLDAGTLAALAREAARHGIKPDRGEVLVRRACRSAGLELANPAPADGSGPADHRTVRCRSCGGLTSHRWASTRGDRACRHCQAPLTWDCPNCKATAWLDEPKCPGCRLSRVDAEAMARRFEAARSAHKARRWGQALEHLEAVRRVAPRHVGARKGEAIVKQAMARIDAAREAFAVEKARSRLVAALELAENWARLAEAGDPEAVSARREASEGLRRAGRLAARARVLARSDPASARSLYRRALAVAADLPEAVEGLHACPPDGPSQLQVAVGMGKVRLRWTAPPPDGLGSVEFRVLRKPDAAPSHSQDGRAVAEVESPEWDDPEPPVGAVVGYSVYTVRRGVASEVGASAGPILVAVEVRDLRAEGSRGEVRLHWTEPLGAAGVRVVRRTDGPVQGPRDGSIVESGPGSAIDRGLEDGRVHHYGVYALYRAPDGRLHPGPGAFAHATPREPSRVVEDLIATPEPDGRVRLDWTPPMAGEVVIYRTRSPIPFPAGTVRTARQLRALDPTAFAIEAEAPGLARDPQPVGHSSGTRYYSPVCVLEGSATFGRPASYTPVPDPVELRATRTRAGGGAGARALLRWQWPPEVEECLVVSRRGEPPEGAGDPSASTTNVRRADYEKAGQHSLPIPPGPGGDIHLLVLGIVGVNGRRAYSMGREPTARAVVAGADAEVAVRYRVRPPLVPGRTWRLTLETDPPGSEVPPTALVANPRAVPLGPDDGRIVARFPAAADGARLPFKPPRRTARRGLRLFVDPTADPDSIPPIRFHHPDTESTRV